MLMEKAALCLFVSLFSCLRLITDAGVGTDDGEGGWGSDRQCVFSSRCV